ncbi:acyl-CoA dehydrogenase family protein [Peribacillus butanolivorans]|uniref:acyl-CoA dehydrogenase family protein n=1 Tax=Peribacillus butanolivorans TaxID=421767 RepID=UPI0036491FF5
MNNGFALSDEMVMLRDSVRKFIKKEIIPREQLLELDAPFFPTETLQEVQKLGRELGLWYVEVPEEYGGANLSVFAQAIVAEEASQHKMGAYNAAGGAFGYQLPNVIFKGTREQIEKYAVPTIEKGRAGFVGITEPSGGADPARAIQTRAVRDGNKWIINGSKIFISCLEFSDWGVVYARTSEGRNGITAFLVDVDAPGFSYNPIPVIRSWSPKELIFDNCEIPLENQLGEEGQGFKLAEHWLTTNRVSYAAGCIGIAVAALNLARDYAKQRVTFKTPLADKQAIQWMIADSEVELRAARWLTWEAAWKADRGESFKNEASIAKLYATETANRVVDKCVQIFGGMGVSKEFPFERWFRELRIKRIGEGPSEVHRMVIARNLLMEGR